MKKLRFYPLAILFVLTLLAGCKNNNNTSTKKNVTGRPGEMVVVMQEGYWKGELGSYCKEVLAQPQMGLPAEEPLFNLIQIPHEAFTDIFLTTRNLMIFKVSPGNKKEILFQKDVHAFTQAVSTISASNAEEAKQVMQENRDKILGFFLVAERNRLLYSYENIHEKTVTTATKEKFGFTLNMLPGTKVATTTDSFMWLRYETPEISQGIFIYTFPYDSDSTFTEKYLIIKRNLFLHDNVPGSVNGSYMTTEADLPFLFNTFKVNGNYAAETRGLWKMENDFMGGPFINLAILDLLNKRVIVLDGYVYAPGKDKRNLLRQVEAMMYSIKFDKQEDMDKLNKQFDL
jgi:hypothetical protein